MASAPNVLCLFGAPDEKSCRAAVARCIGLIQRRHAVSLCEIAKAGDCHANTIENASKEETTLSLVTFTRLRFYFDAECFEPWERLCRPEAIEPPSLEDRLDRIEREASAIRGELGFGGTRTTKSNMGESK